jgi:hypothetical protein
LSRLSRSGGRDIRGHEISPFEQQWFAGTQSESVGGAIAKVQSCLMSAFSKPPECTPRLGELFLVEGNDFNGSLLKEAVKVVPRLVSPAAFQNHRCLEH